jgi:hypothetical protein
VQRDDATRILAVPVDHRSAEAGRWLLPLTIFPQYEGLSLAMLMQSTIDVINK